MLWLAQVEPVRPSFSWTTLASMIVVLGVSALMYALLVRRWTSRRQWVSLAEWCRESGFYQRPARRDALPVMLQEVAKSDEQVRFHLSNARTMLVQLDAHARQMNSSPQRFNLLVRHRAVSGPAAALRPAAQKLSLIDLLPLSKYASMTLGERFIVYADDSRAAQQLAESAALTLVPRDLGLIFFENYLVLDFSSRPFDPIEFGRMIALSEQVQTIVI